MPVFTSNAQICPLQRFKFLNTTVPRASGLFITAIMEYANVCQSPGSSGNIAQYRLNISCTIVSKMSRPPPIQLDHLCSLVWLEFRRLCPRLGHHGFYNYLRRRSVAGGELIHKGPDEPPPNYEWKGNRKGKDAIIICLVHG